MKIKNEPSSFRDNSAHLFFHEDTLYRGITNIYQTEYDLLISSGLYKELVDQNLLINHEEVENPTKHEFYKVIKPEFIPFISYPYEWSFTQIKDAALLTLEIQKKALNFGMTLKDASIYNVQFYKGKPVFIDTCSFEKYSEGVPWVAYGQFCRHFLGPLLLTSYTDFRLSFVYKDYIDGIPLDLVSKLLPFKGKTSLLYLMHILTQNQAKNYVAKEHIAEKDIKISKQQQLGLIESLISGIQGLQPAKEVTTWADYYNNTNYTDRAMEEKVHLVSDWVHEIKPATIWDLGGNNGKFCRDIKYAEGNFVCLDIDVSAIEDCYQQIKKNNEKNILPLLADLTNPTPGIGWDNLERKSLKERGPADMAFALALVHHLAIGNNVPLERIAQYFAELTNYLIIEFIPKTDSQTKKLLLLKEDIFTNYTQEKFENVFLEKFEVIKKSPVPESDRTLYLMRKK